MRDRYVGASKIRCWVLQFKQELGEASGLGMGEKSLFKGGIQKLVTIWQTCIDEVGRDYVEKW
jgi:hypothetical protein